MAMLQRPGAATWATCRIPRILYRLAERPADTTCWHDLLTRPADTTPFSTDFFGPLLQAAPITLQILKEGGCQPRSASSTAVPFDWTDGDW
jgi:hypothetical protein